MDRFVFIPGRANQRVMELVRKMRAAFWVPEEIDPSRDLIAWRDRLSDDERMYIKHVLAFFACADGIVFENVSVNFIERFSDRFDIRFAYAEQLRMECIHAETYSKLIECYIPDAIEQADVFASVKTWDVIRRKAEWAMRYMKTATSETATSETATLAETVVAFVFVEGVFFSAAFCAIFWLKKRGLMHGLTFSNELIARDEGLHQELGCVVYNDILGAPLPPSRIVAMAQDAVVVEDAFIDSALPVRLVGMNAGEMKQYVRFVTDQACRMLRVPDDMLPFRVVNPFPWMDMITLPQVSNFYERRTAEYTTTTSVHGSAVATGVTLQDF